MDRLIAEIKVDKDELREVAKEVFERNLDGITNGQAVMQALVPLFPDLRAKTVEDFHGLGCYIELIVGKFVIALIPIDWWEEPYEGGKK